MNIEEFYEADERRRRSEEIELGTEWHDRDGVRHEVSWVADTGELYVMREPAARISEDPFGDAFQGTLPVDAVTVAVVGWIPTRDGVEAVMVGWPDAMAGTDSLVWLAGRLRDEAVPKAPPAS
ncbi:MAG TPA: hypothetical protein VMU64_02835 [Acidimicrobiales bacterium]|nr:hypothetical protein [Acidimicrobiales bacterium]